MGIIIDIIAVIILALTIIFGYKKGLVGVAYKLVAFIVAIILTLILFTPVANYMIENTKIDDTVYNTIVEKMGNGQEVQYTQVEYIDNYISQMKNDSVETVAKQIAEGTTTAIAAVGLFIVIRIILIVFYKFSEKLAELPFVKQFNKAGGIVYGVLEGVLIIYLAIYIAVLIATVSGNISWINTINDSMIGRIIMNFL